MRDKVAGSVAGQRPCAARKGRETMAGTVVNVLVGLGSAAVVLGVIASHFRRKKSGGCGGCASSNQCCGMHNEAGQPCCGKHMPKG